MNDPTFVRPVARRVVDALDEKHISCLDCPHWDPVPTRETPWEGVAPYVLAFISVDKIVSNKPDGTRLPFPKLSFHVCTGINTVADLPHDDGMARLGFATAHSFKEAAGDELLEVINEPEYLKLTTDDQRTAYARRRLQQRLMAVPQLRSDICTVARGLQPDVGIIVTGCPESR